MGLEARAREQSGVPNPCRRVLLIAQSTLKTPCPGVRSAQRATLSVIFPALAAIDSLPHQLPFAFAGKEEPRGACPLDSIGR